MKKTIPVSDLDRWKKNYSNQVNIANDETKAALLSLDQLQQFIDDAKTNSPGFNGVRIYFIRYNDPDDQLRPFNGYVKEIGDTGSSQVSLALVPVKNFDPITLAGDDILQAGNTINTIAICHPSDWPTGTTLTATYETGTGLCPPKGNCT